MNQIEAALHLSAIVESSDDAIISKNLDGIMLSWNKGAQRIFGYTADEAIGQKVTILIPSERADEESRILRRIGKGERIEHYQTVRHRKDGSQVDISLTISPIRDAGGRVIGASKIARDISAQVRDHELLLRSEDRFRVTLASIGDALICTDHEGRVTFMNAVAEHLTGWRQRDTAGTPLTQSFRIVNEHSRQVVESPVARVLREGTVVGLGNDTILISKDGTERPIDDSAAPIRNTAGDVIGVVLVFRDVSERRVRELTMQRLASIVDNSRDAIYSTTVASDPSQAIIKTWNRAAELLYGYSAAEIVGKPLSLLIPPERVAEEIEVLSRLQKGDNVELYESRRLTRDGRQIEVSVSGSPLKDAKGRIVGVSKIARDITARKRAEAALRESEALKTGMLNAGLDAIITINQATEVVEFNAAAERIFGCTRQDALGKRIRDLIVPPSHREAHDRGVARYLVTGETQIIGRRIEVTAMRADGSEFPCELAVFRVPLEGPPLFTASLRDVTERKQAEQALRESEEQFRTLADNISQLAWMADEQGSIYWYNKRWYDYTGTTLAEVQGEGWKKVHHPEHVERVAARIQLSFASGEPWEDLFPLRGKDGSYRWFLSRAHSIKDASGRVVRWLGTNTDITEQHATEEALRRSALHDALTDLPNRAYFAECVSQALARVQRDPRHRVAVLLLDCDGFKAVNDSLGHTAGDRLLVEMAARLRKCVRPGDVVARLGGDEFTVLLNEVTGVPDVEQVARRIQAALGVPLVLQDRELITTASIGAAISEPDPEQPHDLLQEADLAMYHAKQQGRGRFHLFDVGLRDSAQARFDMEADLRNALERQEFRLFFQPIVELETGQVRGFEALVRWQRTRQGSVVAPVDFLALAEQTGLILPIGNWVLREACRQARTWQDAFPVRVSVNLSAKQLRHPDLVEEVRQVLRDTGIEPSFVVLEVAERVLMENVEASKAALHRLRELGVDVHMDSFGIAYASLADLRLLPLQGTKVDGSLVHRIGLRRTDMEVVRSIVDLARSLGHAVIAEGVETIVQRERLIAFGCELGQGHLFAKPLEPGAASALLAATRPAARSA